MWRRLCRWLASLVVAGWLALPAWAQDPGTTDKPPERGAPAFAHAIALVTLLLVLVIVCMPTRKR